MLDDAGGAVGEGELERHGQAGGAQRQALGVELALTGFVAAFLTEGDGGKGVGVIGPMEMGVDIPGIEGGIEGRLARSIAEALLGLGHEREEVADVGLIEGLGQLSQDELTQLQAL